MLAQIKDILVKLVFTLIFVFMYQFLVADHPSLKWPDMRYTLLVCLAIVAFTSTLQDSRDIIKIVFLPAAISALAIPKLLSLTKSVGIFGNMVWSELGFFLYAYLLVAVLHYFMYVILKHRFMIALIATLKILIFLYPLTFIVYYIVSKDLFDTTALIALYQTNVNESKEFLFGMFSPITAAVTLVILSFSYYLFFVSTRQVRFYEINKSKYSIIIVAILLMLTPLRITDSYLKKIVDNSKEYLVSVKNFKTYRQNADGTDKFIAATSSLDGENQTFILIMGESQGKDHLNAYGYQRPTTPWLTQKREDSNFMFFENAYSSDTLTMKVLSMALTEANQYNKRDFAETYSIIDIAKAAGFHTIWISNQAKFGSFSTPTTVISDMCDRQIWVNEEADLSNKFDDELLKYLHEIPHSGRNLVIIHLSGSHYEYKDRYPAMYDKFSGADGLPTNGIKSVQKVNEYDNSVLYTDHILNEIYGYAEKNKNVSGVIYFSDHGEDVFADNKHLVGLFSFRMSRIPLFIYLSPNYRSHNKDIVTNLYENRNKYFSNDFMYDTVLNILKIDPKFYNPSDSLASDKYNHKAEDLTTLNGAIKLSSDEK